MEEEFSQTEAHVNSSRERFSQHGSNGAMLSGPTDDAMLNREVAKTLATAWKFNAKALSAVAARENPTPHFGFMEKGRKWTHGTNRAQEAVAMEENQREIDNIKQSSTWFSDWTTASMHPNLTDAEFNHELNAFYPNPETTKPVSIDQPVTEEDLVEAESISATWLSLPTNYPPLAGQRTAQIFHDSGIHMEDHFAEESNKENSSRPASPVHQHLTREFLLGPDQDSPNFFDFSGQGLGVPNHGIPYDQDLGKKQSSQSSQPAFPINDEFTLEPSCIANQAFPGFFKLSEHILSQTNHDEPCGLSGFDSCEGDCPEDRVGCQGPSLLAHDYQLRGNNELVSRIGLISPLVLAATGCEGPVTPIATPKTIVSVRGHDLFSVPSFVRNPTSSPKHSSRVGMQFLEDLQAKTSINAQTGPIISPTTYRSTGKNLLPEYDSSDTETDPIEAPPSSPLSLLHKNIFSGYGLSPSTNVPNPNKPRPINLDYMDFSSTNGSSSTEQVSLINIHRPQPSSAAHQEVSEIPFPFFLLQFDVFPCQLSKPPNPSSIFPFSPPILAQADPTSFDSYSISGPSSTSVPLSSLTNQVYLPTTSSTTPRPAFPKRTLGTKSAPSFRGRPVRKGVKNCTRDVFSSQLGARKKMAAEPDAKIERAGADIHGATECTDTKMLTETPPGNEKESVVTKLVRKVARCSGRVAKIAKIA